MIRARFRRILLTVSLCRGLVKALSVPPSPLPPSDSDRTIWDEISCTSALVHHPLVVLGDLHVNGRIQLLASANLTVYEESFANSSDDEVNSIETRQLSKFANERCSHTVIATRSGDIPTLSGDLYLPHSNLIIGADLLVVGGSVKSKGLSIDSAGTVIINARTLEKDPQCESMTHGRIGLKVSHGLVHVKNGSTLLMHGALESPAIGADRGGTIEIACGAISAKDSTGQIPGDIVILGSSSLTISSGKHHSTDEPAIAAQSLFIGENSLLNIDGGDLAVESIKVAGYAAAMIKNASIATNLLLVTGGSITRCFACSSIHAKTAVIVGMGATLRCDPFSNVSGNFDGPLSLRRLQQGSSGPSPQTTLHKTAAPETTKVALIAGAFELTDGAIVNMVTSSADFKEHLSVDDWSELEINGDVKVGEWVSVSNMSRAIFRDPLEVGTSMQIKFGGRVDVRSAQVACSLIVAGGSKLIGRNFVLRRIGDTSLENLSLEECQKLTPAMLISQHSEAEIASVNVNGTIFLNNHAQLSATSLNQVEGGVIVKKESKFLIQGGLFARTQFIDTSGLSNSTIQASLSPIHVEGLRVEDSSQTSIRTTKLYLDWVDVHSRSRLIADVDDLYVRQELVVEEVSEVTLSGSITIEGAYLSAVKSRSQIGGRCNDKTRIDIIQLRDASQASFQSTFNKASRPDVELLSGSHIDLICPVRDGLAVLQKSTDSTVKAHSSWQTLARNISMAVPPSESMSIKYLTPKTIVDGFGGGGGNTTTTSNEWQRKTKASGWKTMEKLNNATTAAETKAVLPVMSLASSPVSEDPLENGSPVRKATSSKEKRRRKDE